MIDIEIFKSISFVLYLCSFVCAMFITLSFDYSISKLNGFYDKFYNILILFFSFSFILLIGNRSIEIGTDTQTYELIWEYTDKVSFDGEFVFNILIVILKYFNFTFSSFLFFVVLLFSIYIYKTYTLIGSKINSNAFLLYFSLLSFFFFETLTINIIRQGLALSLGLYGWSLITFTNCRKKAFLYFFISFVTHTTVAIPVVLYSLVVFFGKNIKLKYYLFLYFSGVLLSYFNIGILTFLPVLSSNFKEARRSEYLTESSEVYVVGFKPQFVVFNTVFLFFAWIVIKKVKVEEWYHILFKYYIISSFVFFMFFQIPYSDRIGLFSWVFIPMFFIPFFSYENRGKVKATLLCLFLLLVYLFFNFYVGK
ncbi:EpsG family protein [Myroides phaeus]|uniref:EpsG family protein n=1 Tax=Myroides phaeus TaxID=702745 RepID=UPI002DBD4459|nr:EpsG family protein [Myroides phaeus]MEC4116369.1 EpsG family protein [Myroides phaeus]